MFDFGIPKGADAVNPGDMTKAIYDPNNKSQDIFAYVDSITDTRMPKTGGTFTGAVSGVSPTETTGVFRNIRASTTDLTAGTSALNSGEIYLVYE